MLMRLTRIIAGMRIAVQGKFRPGTLLEVAGLVSSTRHRSGLTSLMGLVLEVLRRLHQEAGCSHPGLDRAEGRLDSVPSTTSGPQAR